MSDSAFKYIGIGVVAETKNKNSKFISVIPIEKLPMFTGEVTNQFTTMNFSGTDTDGASYSHKLYVGASLKAEWKGAPHRVTAPQVIKGNKVDLWEIESTETYYWSARSFGDNDNTAESVTWAFNANGAPLTKNVRSDTSNHYTITIDGANGNITVTTSQANGELAKYTAQINGKTGHVSVQDNLGNYSQIDSTTNTISAVNGDKSFFSISGKNVNCYAADNINLNSASINITGNLSVKGDYTVTGNTTLSTVTATDIKSSTVTVDSLSAKSISS